MNIVLKNGVTKKFDVDDIEQVMFSEGPIVEPVDLGLSVKWATCNVGASVPEEYGYYFAYGEISEKPCYDMEHYNYADALGIHKEIMPHIAGTDMDAATAQLGYGWRMPTEEEVKELLDCDWVEDCVNGVWGVRVTGHTGNSIFLPAAGHRAGTELFDAGSVCAYRLSQPTEGGVLKNVLVAELFYNNVLATYTCLYNCVEHGYPIRPVYK